MMFLSELNAAAFLSTSSRHCSTVARVFSKEFCKSNETSALSFASEYMEIKVNVSMMKESIVFDNNAGTLDIDDSKTVELKFDGERITLADLKTDDILTVKEAQRIDKSKIFIADVSRDVIEGNIQYYDSDEAGSFFEVEGEKHYLSDSYLDFIKNNPNEKLPKSGDYIRAYLGYDSKIAAVKSDKDFSYGYVVSCAYDESDEVVIMKLFTLEGNMKRYYFADRVTVYNDKNLNGIKKEKFDAHKLLGDIKYNTVAYTLNSEGFVTSVAKEIDRTEFVPATIDYPLVLNYNVSDHNGGETWLYRGVLAKKYSIKGSVIVYPGQESMRSDDNAYGIRSAGYWGTEHYFDKDEYMKVYNCDKFYKSGFCTMAGATAVSLDQGTGGLHMFCIESISDTIDEDDMPAKVIKYMENGSKKTAAIAEDCKFTMVGKFSDIDSVDELSRGDIIQIGKNAKGEISIIGVLFEFAKRKDGYGAYTGTAFQEDAAVFSSLNVIYAKIEDREGTIALINTSKDGTNPKYSSPISISLDGTYSKPYYVIYDTKKKEVTNASLAEIQAGDEVVMRKYYNHVLDVVIIR